MEGEYLAEVGAGPYAACKSIIFPMAERPVTHFRVLFAVIIIYLVIVNGVAFWRQKNGDHFYVCVSPSEQSYVLVQAACSKGECTSTEVDATGAVRTEASYTAGSIYTNNATDTAHSGCVEITAKEAETLAPVAAHGEAMSDVEVGVPANFDSANDLAYIRKIETINGVRMITFDSMTLSGGPGSGDEVFVFENDDTTMVTLPLDDNAGPFFITYNGGDENHWRTMDDEQINALIGGTADANDYVPDYYSPFLTGDIAVFHIVQKDGKVTKVLQKYFP